MKATLTLFVLLLSVGSASAQLRPTVVLGDTEKFAWTASPDNDTTVGSPAVPVVSSYKVQFFLRTDVVNQTTIPVPSPTAVPQFTVDVGKPPKDGTGTQLSTPVKPMLGTNVNKEYVAFIVTSGPAGDSPRSEASDPFVLLGPPRPVVGPVRTRP
jgi:hypothetical protein